MNNQFDKPTKNLPQSVTRRAAPRQFIVGLVGMALPIAIAFSTCPASGANFVGFNTGPFYSIVGAFDSPTEGTVLQVLFGEPVLVDTFVSIASSDPTVLMINSGGVTIQAGQAAAPAHVSAFALGNVTFTASYNAIEATAEVRVVSQIPIIPTLSIESLPGMVRLAWKTNAAGFLLETNAAPAAPGGWGVVASTFEILGTNFVFTNALSDPARFFRLRMP